MTQIEIGRALEEISDMARHMRPPLNSKPEAWHEDKSELLSKIAKLKDDVRTGVRI